MTHAVSAASKGDAVKPLHNASTADSYADLPFLPAGGVASAKGFKACGIHAGFRADPKRLDFALVAADQPAACAAVFTLRGTHGFACTSAPPPIWFARVTRMVRTCGTRGKTGRAARRVLPYERCNV